MIPFVLSMYIFRHIEVKKKDTIPQKIKNRTTL